jgi:predicted AlkP superfamily phosphohydrolase/phosphomutase
MSVSVTSAATAGRVLIIGLDGATWTNLLPRARSGQMPALQKLIQEGAWGVLNSTIPALTPPAWASLVTGVNPGKHGIYHFRHTPAGDYYQRRLNTSRDIRVPTLWQRVGQSGLPVGVINVPLSYPVYPVNGFITSDAFAPDPNFTVHPPELASEFRDVPADISRYPKGTPGTGRYRDEMIAFIEENERLLIRHTDVAERLMQRQPWRFFMVVWLILDRLQHYAWKFCDATGSFASPLDQQIAERCAEAFRQIDAQIARLIKAGGDDCTVILASDHGFGPSPSAFFHPNRWLAKKGYLRRLPAWKWQRWFWGHFPRIWRGRWGIPLDSKFGVVDWRATRVWADCLEARAIGLRINRAGTYAEGIVTDTEYEALRRQLTAELSELMTESGQKVVARIHAGSELYRGPCAGAGPDLVAILEKPFDAPPSFRRDMICREWISPNKHVLRDGSHEPEGILLLSGKPVRAGQLPAQHLEAIVPTALCLLGIAPANDLDAAPITAALKEEPAERTPVEELPPPAATAHASSGQPEYSGKDASLVEERLRKLGYLD